MNHIKYIILALICAIVTAPVAAKGVCAQSELDSVTEMSNLQARLFNAGELSGVKVLLYLQPFYNETRYEGQSSNGQWTMPREK